MHRLRSCGAALVIAAALSACSARPSAPPPDLAAAPPEVAPNYLIGPGDTLGIFVYRAPELSVDLPVRPDGRISMPLIPDIQAAGLAPTELASAIQERLKEYLREPNVTVMVKGFVGPSNRLVRVIGEAAEPIAIPYREGMTLLDVLIASRGLTRYAAGNRAELVRREAGGMRTISVRLSDLLRDGDMTQDVAMRPGDTLIIPQSWF